MPNKILFDLFGETFLFIDPSQNNPNFKYYSIIFGK